MLVDVYFPFSVRYLAPHGRRIRHETHLSRATISVREVDAKEAPRAYFLTPAPTTKVLDGKVLRTADPIELVAFEEDVWWPVRTVDNTADVSVEEWTSELGKQRGNHTISTYRPARRIPDVLELRTLLGPMKRTQDWPEMEADKVASRRTLEGNHDIAVTHLHRAANDVLIRNGRLFARTGEPLWLLDAPMRHFRGGTIPLDLCPVPRTRPLESLLDPIDLEPPRAFENYELFRFDRKRDADLWRAEKLELDRARKERQFTEGTDRYSVEVFEAPPIRAEPLAPMLRDYGAAVMTVTATMIELVRDTIPPALRALPDQVIMSEYGTTFLQRLAGLAAPKPYADAIEMLIFLDEVACRLDGIDYRNELWGFQKTMMMCLERARRRAASELADGTLPPGFTIEDVSLLSAALAQ
ncbi:hypothetical protein ACVIGB_001143 [Bradyrhizobium sp. USDA 4341]